MSLQGTRLGGRYRILDRLGEGGMATVYVALDEKLGRQVAVKVLHDHFSSNQDIRMRFEQEATAISKMDHPNIVKVYDFSGGVSQRLWIVTEILNGENLARFAKRFTSASVPPNLATAIACEICKALEHAHSKEIIHRDIKPENVMLLQNGAVKLMDFGIAKNLHAATSMTLTGTFMGSPSYMSPEQVRGRDVGPSSDIYSLSVLFYEIVTGKLPFPGVTTHDVIIKIVEGRYTEPQFLVTGLPKTTNEIICKGMAKDWRERYGSARSFRQTLEDYLRDQGIADSQLELKRFVKERVQTSGERSKTYAKRTLSRTGKHSRNNMGHGTAYAQAQLQALAEQRAHQASTGYQRGTSYQQTFAATQAAYEPRVSRRRRIRARALGHVAHRTRSMRKRLPPVQQSLYRQPPSGLTVAIGSAMVAAVLFIAGWGFLQLFTGQSSFRLKPVPVEKPSHVVRDTTPKNQSPQKNKKIPTKNKVRKKKVTNKRPDLQQRRITSSTGNKKTERKESPAIYEPKNKKQKDEKYAAKTQNKAETTNVTKQVEATTPTNVGDARIWIASNVSAKITVDGSALGTTTDHRMSNGSGWKKVSPGRHQLVLSRPGYAPYKTTINLTAGDRKRLTGITLQANSADSKFPLRLVSAQVPVRMVIENLRDGTRRVKTAYRPRHTISMAPGIYRITFSHDGAMLTKTINVSSTYGGQTVNINFDKVANQ